MKIITIYWLLTCTLERISAHEERCSHLWTTINHKNIQRHILPPHLHTAAADLTLHWCLTWPIALISWPWGPSAVIARGGGRSNGSPALWRQSLIHPWVKGNSKVRWGFPWQLEQIYFVEQVILVEYNPHSLHSYSRARAHMGVGTSWDIMDGDQEREKHPG